MKKFVSTESHPNTIVLSPDKKLLFVSTRGRNNPDSYIVSGPEFGVVQVFDASTGVLLDALVGKNQPTGLDLSHDGRMLASSDFLDANINIYGIPTTDVFLQGASPATKTYRSLMKK